MRTPVKNLTWAGVMTALVCALGPLTLPLGPVPLSLTTALLMLCALLAGPRQASAVCGAYLLLGCAGLPVFSGFTGGAGQLLGPTGGFLMGYLPMTALSGWVLARTERRLWQFAGLAAATALLHAMGTLWYAQQAAVTPAAAAAVCVLPFLPGDAVKMVLVLTLGRGLQRRLRKVGALPQGRK